MPDRDPVRSMFATHNNYVRCIASNLNGFELTTTLQPTATLPIEKIDKFLKLSEMTHNSIRDEIEACFHDSDYTQVVAPWMPVKCYYRLYYLESVMLYLLSGSAVGFTHGGHMGVRKNIKSYVVSGQLTASNSVILQSATVRDALAHTIPSGTNLSPNFHITTDCIDSLKKKLAIYAEHDFREKNGIKDYRSQASRLKRDSFRATNNINLSDFFYWMRIKANYKDVDYLDFASDISPDDAYMYIMRYAAAQESYAFALETLIKELRVARGM